jgi:accessory colonization factor AcfC
MRYEMSRNLYIAGSGLWQERTSWKRGSMSVWVGWTDWNKGNGRTVAMIRDQSGYKELGREVILEPLSESAPADSFANPQTAPTEESLCQ